ARLDTRGLFDELDRGGRQRLHLAGGDGVGVVGVEAVGEGVVGRDQFLVGDGLFRREQAGGGDDGFGHGRGGPNARGAAARCLSAGWVLFLDGLDRPV